MHIDTARRYDKAKQELVRQTIELLEELRRFTSFPSKFTVTLKAQSEETGEILESKTSIVIPKLINYKTMGRLIGKIGDHQVSVMNDSEGHFRVTIDNKEYPSLPQKFVEEELGIPVQTKQRGKQAGYPSEPVGRAVWRHMAECYNLLDRTVIYIDEYVSF